MIKISPIALFLMLSNIQNIICACQTKTDIDSIFQDKITLKLDKNRFKHDYSYPPVLFGGSSPRVALTIDSLEIRDAPNIQYQIASMLDPSGSLIFNFISTTITARWRQLRLSFWLVNQNFTDISIGHILFENIAPFGNKSLLFSETDELLLSRVGPTTNSKIFLSSVLGLSADVSNKSLSFSSRAELQFYQQSENVTKSNISFGISAGEGTKINLIRLSYILYSPSRLSNIKHVSAALTLELNKQTLNDLTTYYSSIESVLVFPVKYSLIGLTGFKIKNFQSVSLDLSIESGLSNLLKVQSGTQIDTLETDYLIVGVDMTMSCINCSDEYVKTEGSIAICVATNQCNADQIPFATAINSMMNVFSCRKCVGNRQVSVIGDTGKKSCACKTGYKQQADGICRQIETFKSISECPGQNSVRESVSGNCVCKDGFYFDDFNQCSNVCDPSVSSLNTTTSKCVCFNGYIMNEYTQKCIKSDGNCVENQIKVGNTCECDGFTIKTQQTPLICKQCSSGTFKVQDKNECQKCDTSCRECISNQFCLACTRGFYFKDFKCETKCGDAIKKGIQKCDDGNDVNGDGCSNTCQIQQNFVCLEDSNGKSSCYKKGEEPSTSPSVPSQPEPTEHTPVDINAQDYKLSLAQSSPIFQSSGITLELLVKPAIKREQQELRKMIKVEISDSRAIPAMVYIAQDPNNFGSIRCYLHYNNILPVVDFSMKVYAVLGQGIWRTVTASTKSGAKLMSGRAVRSMY